MGDGTHGKSGVKDGQAETAGATDKEEPGMRMPGLQTPMRWAKRGKTVGEWGQATESDRKEVVWGTELCFLFFFNVGTRFVRFTER